MKFKGFSVVPLSKTPARAVVRWSFNSPPDSLHKYEVLIERSIHGQNSMPGFQHVDIHGNPVTPAVESTASKNTAPITNWMSADDFPYYLDMSDVLLNLSRPCYYKLLLRDKSTLRVVDETGLFTWDGDLDLIGLYVIDEHNFLLEDVIGVPCVVYQQKRGGVKCTRCYDPIQKNRLISNCNVCYGTSWVGGYHKPIDCYIDFSPNPKTLVIEAWGETQPNESNILLSNFPDIHPRDIIRELRENRLWRVVNVTQTEKRRVPMLQFARVTEIKPGDVEYRITLSEQLVTKKTDELEATKKRREF